MSDGHRISAATINLRDLLAVMWRRKWLIVAVTTGITAIALLVLVLGKLLPKTSPLNFVPDRYTSSVDILLPISSSTANLSDVLLGGDAGSSLAALSTVSRRTTDALVQDLLVSPTVLDKAAERLKIASRLGIVYAPRTTARRALLKGITTRYRSGSGILTIGFTDTDRDFSARAASALVDILSSEMQRVSLERLRGRLVVLEAALGEQRRTAESAARALSDYKDLVGIANADAAEAGMRGIIGDYEAQLRKKQLEVSLKSTYLPEGDPQMRLLRTEINVLEKTIELVRQGDGGSTDAVALDDLPALQEREALLQREVDLQQGILDTLSRRVEILRLDAMDETSLFQVLTAAEVPETKSAPSRAKLAVVSAGAAFLIAVLLAAIVDYLVRTKRNPPGQGSAVSHPGT